MCVGKLPGLCVYRWCTGLCEGSSLVVAYMVGALVVCTEWLHWLLPYRGGWHCLLLQGVMHWLCVGWLTGFLRTWFLQLVVCRVVHGCV